MLFPIAQHANTKKREVGRRRPPPPVNPNGFRRPGCAGVRRSNFRSGQVQYKMGFDFHC